MMQANDKQARLTVDLQKIAGNAAEIRRNCGVAVLGVVKADAYGLGAKRVAEAIAPSVEGFCVFSLSEAAGLWEIGRKPILVLHPNPDESAEQFLALHTRPAVWDAEMAARLRAARPALCVDTGMQRFACPVDEIDAVLAAGECKEAFTHATRVEHAKHLRDLLGGRGLRLHAAASLLLNEPAARLDAVRPGLAMYRAAVRVAARLAEARDSGKPAGYTGFVTPRFGVILRGYFHGLRVGPCMVNGNRRRILEVGMQSAYVEIGKSDRIGDEVVLLGEGLSEAEVAGAWGTTEHEVLTRMGGM